jgi:hypothetical protein
MHTRTHVYAHSCTRAFKSATALKNHTDGHARSVPAARLLLVGGARRAMRFTCATCALPFPSKFNLERHAAKCTHRVKGAAEESYSEHLEEESEEVSGEEEGIGGWVEVPVARLGQGL